MQENTAVIKTMSEKIDLIWQPPVQLSEEEMRAAHPVEKLIGYHVQRLEVVSWVISSEWPRNGAPIKQDTWIHDGKVFKSKDQADAYGLITYGRGNYRLLPKTFYFSKDSKNARTFNDTAVDREADAIQGDKLEPVSYDEDPETTGA